jgi:sec-independent protein translocase protein TatA
MFGTNIGLMELGIIAVILLVLFGAKRIPLLLGSIGEGIREFRDGFRKDELNAPDAEEAKRRERLEDKNVR